MFNTIRDRWTEALLSGKYRQGRRQLKSNDGGYCCLGVLCEIAKEDNIVINQPYPHRSSDAEDSYVCVNDEDDHSITGLPRCVQAWADIDTANPSWDIGYFTYFYFDPATGGKTWVGDSLAGCNDAGVTFKQIVDIIKWGF